MSRARGAAPPDYAEIAAVVATALLSVGLDRVPHRWELPGGIGAAGAMLALARESGADLASEGLDPSTARDGLRLGLLIGVPAAMAVMAASRVPALRQLFRHEHAVDAGPGDIAYHLFARIPFATAMAEEVIFRSALLGIFSRRRSPLAAAAISSALFGVWHVLPTLRRLAVSGGNDARPYSPSQRVVGVAAVVGATAVAGMGFCWLQRRSRSVVAPIVVHAALNGSGLLAGWLSARSDRAG